VLIAVPVNSATVMFTMNAFDPFITSFVEIMQIESYFSTMKVVFFLLLQFVVFMLLAFVHFSVPDRVFDYHVTKERTSQVLANLALIEQFKTADSKLKKVQEEKLDLLRKVDNKTRDILKLNEENEKLKNELRRRK
jgi:peptidoglycan hydrolase CwlO-like protein